tara:strand:+ start:1227 stop:1850 length:624 start_codon:yes stop_codon:yes gene_type:complete
MGLISSGTTIFDSGAMASGFGGAMTLIKKLTASSSATLDFLNGSSGVIFDSTYKEYVFMFKDIHPATDDVVFSFQADTGTNTSYNQTITSANFAAQHGESDSPTELSETGSSRRLAQQQIFQPLSGHNDLGNDNDQCLAGYLHIFDPANTTFVKHFMAVTNQSGFENRSVNSYVAGYFNTTTALTRVRFKMSSGNIDAGTVSLYGIS